MLIFLILVPLAVVYYVRLQQRRKRNAARYGSLGFVQGAPGSRPGIRRHIPPLLFLAGLTILLVSLARPQTTVQVPRVQGTVILAFDVSGSMAADDMKPTRMDAAKAAAKDFVQRQPTSVQVGVVGFSDSGFSIQAPTNDSDTVIAAINRLAPQRGTSVGHGIEASLNAIAIGTGQSGVQGQPNTNGEPANLSNQNGPAPTPTAVPKGTHSSAVIVLLTDGENNENPDPIAAAQAAAGRGVRVYTVGIGSAAGTNVHINGFTVHTQLDESLLKQIAQTTQGAYYNADNAQDLHTIYDNLDPELFIKPEQLEVTSLFAGASILVMLIGGLFSMVWFSRMP